MSCSLCKWSVNHLRVQVFPPFAAGACRATRPKYSRLILVYHGAPSLCALGLHPDLSALPFQESLHRLFSFVLSTFCPSYSGQPQGGLAMAFMAGNDGVFSQSLHFEKSFFKEHAAEWACAFVQPGQKNAAQ